MANLKVKNADGDTQCIGIGRGETASDGDPIVVWKEVKQGTCDDICWDEYGYELRGASAIAAYKWSFKPDIDDGGGYRLLRVGFCGSG